MEAKPPPAPRWSKEWVPQDVISTGGSCSLLKWVTEDMMASLKQKRKESEKKPEPEPTSEILYLCSYEGCGKTFLDVGTLRKHVHTHGERQHVCHYKGCGKKFFDSSKLKRHFLTHTGEKHFICPRPGCGKAFSLDFNLRSHMKIHSPEKYHVCPHDDCGRKYTHESKLNSHRKLHHGKNARVDTVKHSFSADKPQNMTKTPATAYGYASSDRPYVCPHEGCGKDYIHEYKLNLHLKKEHSGQTLQENGRYHGQSADHAMDEASDQDTLMKTVAALKTIKRSKPSPKQQMPPSKVPKRTDPSSTPTNTSTVKKQWPISDTREDSEETEDDREDAENSSDDSDDETEDEN